MYRDIGSFKQLKQSSFTATLISFVECTCQANPPESLENIR